MKIGLVSLLGHTVIPLATSLFVAYLAPEPIDWFILAFWVAVFALYQYLIDPFILRDKMPSVEYYEFSLYVVAYSVLNMLGVV